MNSYAVFFDLDGTIYHIKTGMPQDTKDALKELLKKGHQAFLCTGRSYSYLPEEVISLGLTGIVAGCGTYLEYRGKRLYNRIIPADVAEQTVRVLRKYGLVPVMEGPDYMYYDKEEYTEKVNWYSPLMTRQLKNRWRPISGNETCMSINKLSAKTMPGCNLDKACEELSNYYEFIRHRGSKVGATVEMIPKGESKAKGICRLIEQVGIPWESTIAFGDSNNDQSMFDYVHTKIAMGNGSEEIKEQADYITSAYDQGGIRQGLRYLGLI